MSGTLQAEMVEILLSAVRKGVAHHLHSALVEEALGCTSGRHVQDKVTRFWWSRMELRREDGEEDQYLSFSSLSDAYAWGQVLGLAYLHSTEAFIYRSPCSPVCEVCNRFYVDVTGSALPVSVAALLSGPVNNLAALAGEITDAQGNILKSMDWGVRSIGCAHKWDTPSWRLSSEEKREAL